MTIENELEALYREIGQPVAVSYLPRKNENRAVANDARDIGEEGDKIDQVPEQVEVYMRFREEEFEKGEGGRPRTGSITARMSGANTYSPREGDTFVLDGTEYTMQKIEPRRLFGRVTRYTIEAVR